MEAKFKCHYCQEYRPLGESLITSELNGRICSDCLNNYIKRCPCCGKLAYIDSGLRHIYYNPYIYEYLMQGEKNKQKLIKHFQEYGSRCINLYTLNDANYNDEKLDNDLKDKNDIYLLELHCCKNCEHQIMEDIKYDPSSIEIEFDRMWFGCVRYTFVDPSKAEKYLWRNLEKATLEDFQTERVLH
jgi:hypothetical protein